MDPQRTTRHARLPQQQQHLALYHAFSPLLGLACLASEGDTQLLVSMIYFKREIQIVFVMLIEKITIPRKRFAADRNYYNPVQIVLDFPCFLIA